MNNKQRQILKLYPSTSHIEDYFDACERVRKGGMPSPRQANISKAMANTDMKKAIEITL